MVLGERGFGREEGSDGVKVEVGVPQSGRRGRRPGGGVEEVGAEEGVEEQSGQGVGETAEESCRGEKSGVGNTDASVTGSERYLGVCSTKGVAVSKSGERQAQEGGEFAEDELVKGCGERGVWGGGKERGGVAGEAGDGRGLRAQKVGKL